MLVQEPSAQELSSDGIDALDRQLDALQQKAEQHLLDQVHTLWVHTLETRHVDLLPTKRAWHS